MRIDAVADAIMTRIRRSVAANSLDTRSWQISPGQANDQCFRGEAVARRSRFRNFADEGSTGSPAKHRRAQGMKDCSVVTATTIRRRRREP